MNPLCFLPSPARCVLVGASLLSVGQVQAIPITLTDATPTYYAEVANCNGLGAATYTHCTSTAAFNQVSLVGGDAAFRQSFDAWNAGNAAASKWQLKDGGALPGGRFEVNAFDALAQSGSGGMTIRVLWTYGGADKADYHWAQGLYDNFTLSPAAIIEPFYEMDVLTGAGLLAPPLYPYEYDNRRFFDEPSAPWPDAFFIATAFLSQVDATNRILTVYEGIGYEFHLEAPEPPAALLVALGLGGLLAWRRRGRRG